MVKREADLVPSHTSRDAAIGRRPGDFQSSEGIQLPDSPDPRYAALHQWLADDAGIAAERIEPASGDASFRRYFRVFARERQYIAMDAPPGKENPEPFLRVAAWLRAMGLNAPAVHASDLDAGFVLLDDLGDLQYLEALRERPARADVLYHDALVALDRMQHAGAEYQSQLPPYDVRLLRRELALFRDWLCARHLGLDFSDADEAAWRLACDFLVEASLAQPRVFVHRDYHSRNLMVTDENNPGILDFQDAVEGPLTYDLVSLLKDCYVSWPAHKLRGYLHDYYRLCQARLPRAFDRDAFLRAFELTGVQRHLKAAGIFARLKHRDGKDGYLADVPRTLRYVLDVAPRYEELAFLHSLIRERCLPALEAAA